MNRAQPSSSSALASLTDWLAERAAVLPPLPDGLVATLRQRAPEWWETSRPAGDHALDAPDPTDAALDAGVRGALDQFLLVRHNGRGYASWFFHVVVARPPLVIVARLLAPSAFADELAGPALGRILAAIGPLAEAADATVEHGALRDDQRLVVLVDERSGRHAYGIARHGAVDWRRATSSSLFADAAAALTCRQPGSDGIGS